VDERYFGMRALCLRWFGCSSSAFLVGILLVPSASAQPAQQSWETPIVLAVQSSPSLWHDEWPQFSWVEAALTLAAGVGTALFFVAGPAKEPRWEGGILFDNAVRDGLRAKSSETRQQFRSIGNVTYYSTPLLPLLVDALAVSLIGRGDAKTAKNLSMMSFEAFAYSGMLSFTATRISARARPDTTQCLRDHPDGVGCGADTESFWSGHTSITATAAGLVCANHVHMPLWGHPIADAAACVLSATNAAVTATTRIVADRHYATDVLVGAGIGFGIGYAVPTLLHYSSGASDEGFTITPTMACGGNCIAVQGAF